MKTFGVGCFHFGVTDRMPSPFSVRDYAAEVRTALGQIANISEIDLHFDDPAGVDEKCFTRDEDIPVFGDGRNTFPYLFHLDLSFDVYLPRRVQAELLEVQEERLVTQSERFRVRMRNCYYSPVGYIQPIDAETTDCSASDAVVILRRYLETEVDKQNGKVKFEFVGPSPFHADFFLQLSQQVTAPPFELAIDRRRGYDEVVFTGSTKQFGDKANALEALFDELDDELSLFYLVIRSRNASHGAWEQVESHMLDVMHSEKRKGLRAYLCRVCTHGQKLGTLVDDLCNFRAFLLSDRQYMEQAYRCTYTSSGYLMQYVDEEFDNPPQFPVNEITELVRFREGRHSRFWETLAVLLSAIIGGLVGGLVTYSLMQTSPSSQNAELPPKDPTAISQNETGRDANAQQSAAEPLRVPREAGHEAPER